ncbi:MULTISPECIES: Lrp/AsnC family transcriptional regulator [Rhizobium]|uniref:AsnC family transcriptional regulator n=2 Tax=Rhizobium grahamii TaxID=1120045 RepID=S3IEV0_9HYPH|nr:MULTISPECIES: Lrp/AsnC family transcriptional regulator [Rhizobium]EPE97563.1 AsnC family transcriptional regulator [Rhizobium grahamii CCGE 502]MBB3316710.1 DNA-binding Lrp family transcriptional regulator [Rhizobium sp. BK181]MBB3541451.1 DNA-binding Lrp family transcriptional regulator [Rhizobium sp. BK399]MCS3740175.1 DNA-binding Lrp family transcriptional regulator [Rhizobium sp. BK661]MCS4091875.1 DNA-binding Lrp family transcriptional regulator [Rhizobium sp. BK176]
MDEKDRQIISTLQRDGRLSNQELSEKVALSPSPCLRRLRLLEENGVIKGYTAIVDEEAYGLPITAFVRIRLERHSEAAIAAFERKVRSIDNIQDCYVMTGEADYLLRVLVQSLKDYEQFVRQQLHNIEGIAGIDTSFAYATVKKTTVFPRI